MLEAMDFRILLKFLFYVVQKASLRKPDGVGCSSNQNLKNISVLKYHNACKVSRESAKSVKPVRTGENRGESSVESESESWSP